jgi:hypothetical protein
VPEVWRFALLAGVLAFVVALVIAEFVVGVAAPFPVAAVVGVAGALLYGAVGWAQRR